MMPPSGPGQGGHVFDGTDYHERRAWKESAHDHEAASWISVAATDHAVHFIRESKQRPFFLNLWLHETHHLVSATTKDKSLTPTLRSHNVRIMPPSREPIVRWDGYWRFSMS